MSTFKSANKEQESKSKRMRAKEWTRKRAVEMTKTKNNKVM
jgi:hypothetical protein